MSIFIAMLLGLVQGLCEFLPVSSSGHLLLLSKAFQISQSGPFFSVMLHLATLIAVVVAYWDVIIRLLKKPIQKKVGYLVISTVVTVVIYLVFSEFFDESMETGAFLGICFLVTGGIVLAIDLIKKRQKSVEQLKLTGAAGVGLMQGIAILPGISRSGATIFGSTLFGLNREAAAEYSFLLSIPAILGGLVMEIPDALKSNETVDLLPLLLGMLVAGVSGYFAVRFMIKLITKKRLYGFAIYVFILGTLVLLDQFAFHIVF